MAPCSLCRTEHPTILGSPNDCVRALSDRVSAIEALIPPEVRNPPAVQPPQEPPTLPPPLPPAAPLPGTDTAG